MIPPGTTTADLPPGKPVSKRSTPYWSWLVLFIGIPLSFLAFLYAQESVNRVGRLQFDRDALAANAIIDTRLSSYTQVLYSLRALFADEQVVDRRRFSRFVVSMNLSSRLPGVLSLNYAAHVPAAAKTDFEKAVRADTSVDPRGYPGFQIKPPGERPEYFVINFLEPMQGYEFAHGLDVGASTLAKDPGRIASAIQTGRDTGSLSASAQPLRVQRDKERIYLAMRLAVYRTGMPLDNVTKRRTAYMGSVGAAFDVESMMKAAIGEKLLPYMRFRLYDTGPANVGSGVGSTVEKRLLFDSNSSTAAVGTTVADKIDYPESVFVSKIPLAIAGRLWEVEFSSPKDATINRNDRLFPITALSSGLLLTLLLFGMVHFLSTSRARAVRLANDITKDLRHSETGLAEAQQMARLGSWTLDVKAWSMTASAETYRILERKALATATPYDDILKLIHTDDRVAFDRALQRAVETGEPSQLEQRIVRPDRSLRWVHTIIKPALEDNRTIVRGTIMDITERKLADFELSQSRAQLLALSRRLVDMQESERRRFSAELHDVVGQNLIALSINLDNIKTQVIGPATMHLSERFVDCAALLASTTDVIENVIAELRPPMLDDYGLYAALDWYAKQFSQRTALTVEMHGDEHMARLPPASEIAIFRVVQEALNNVVKHARATRVDITFEDTPSYFELSVADDGVGFYAVSPAISNRRQGRSKAVTKERRRHSIGMITMRERMEAIGGTFEILQTPGHGTTIQLRVLFPNDNH